MRDAMLDAVCDVMCVCVAMCDVKCNVIWDAMPILPDVMFDVSYVIFNPDVMYVV